MSTSEPALSPTVRLTRGFDRWAFREYRLSGADLGVFRILYAASAGLLAFPDLDRLKGLPPSALAAPPGPFRFLSEWPADWVFETLEVALAVSLAFLLVGYRTIIVSFTTSCLWFASLGLLYSTGKISHSVAAFSIAPVFMAMAGWGEQCSIDSRRRGSQAPPRIRAWPVALFALMVSLMFLSAARPKVEAGWLDPSTHAVQLRVLDRVFLFGTSSGVAVRLSEISSGLLWELIDYGTIALEAGLLVMVLRRRFFMAGLCFAVLFHAANFFVFEISFAVQVISYGAFVRWADLLRPLKLPLRRFVEGRSAVSWPPPRVAVALTAVGGVAVYLYADRYGAPFGALPSPTKAGLETPLFLLWIAGVATYFATAIVQFVRR